MYAISPKSTGWSDLLNAPVMKSADINERSFLSNPYKKSPLCHRSAQWGYNFATEFKTKRLCGSQLLFQFASQQRSSVFSVVVVTRLLRMQTYSPDQSLKASIMTVGRPSSEHFFLFFASRKNRCTQSNNC